MQAKKTEINQHKTSTSSNVIVLILLQFDIASDNTTQIVNKTMWNEHNYLSANQSFVLVVNQLEESNFYLIFI